MEVFVDFNFVIITSTEYQLTTLVKIKLLIKAWLPLPSVLLNSVAVNYEMYFNVRFAIYLVGNNFKTAPKHKIVSFIFVLVEKLQLYKLNLFNHSLIDESSKMIRFFPDKLSK